MKGVFYIPNGPKNLASLFPQIKFDDIEEYYIQVKDDLDAVVASGNLNKQSSCCDEGEKTRVHFLNYLGGIDAVNFKLITIEHESKSDSSEVPTASPLIKSVHGINRFNVNSNDNYVATTIDYTEEDQQWLDELFDSPVAWMEWKGTEGQPDEYLPIVITDKKYIKRKEEERFVYEVTMEFKFSHEKITLRN